MTLKPILKTHQNSPSHADSISIPTNLQQRLISLNIPLDETISKAISLYHSSQVTAALDHVEANYELIKSPKAVFLYQLPKQQIEENQSQPRLPVYTASDFPGYTLQHLKAMYPTHWKSAAQHFGISIAQQTKI